MRAFSSLFEAAPLRRVTQPAISSLGSQIPGGPGFATQLFHIFLIAAAVMFLAVEIGLLYAVFKSRRGRAESKSASVRWPANTYLEAIWALIPAAIVVVIGVYSFRALSTTGPTVVSPLRVDVTLQSGVWQYTYPDIKKMSQQLHLVAGRNTQIHFESNNAALRFAANGLDLDVSLAPDSNEMVEVAPTGAGEYDLECQPTCGAPGEPSAQAVVQDQADFDRWMARNGADLNPQGSGEEVFQTYGCRACHALAAAGSVGGVGPALDGIGARASARVEGLDAFGYIRQSILNPGAYVVPGFSNGLMPTNYSQRLTPVQVDDLVIFLSSQ